MTRFSLLSLLESARLIGNIGCRELFVLYDPFSHQRSTNRISGKLSQLLIRFINIASADFFVRCFFS